MPSRRSPVGGPSPIHTVLNQRRQNPLPGLYLKRPPTDGIHSEFPGNATFTRITNRLQSSGFAHFVYFSYSAAGEGAADGDRPAAFYCTGWGVEACDGSGGWPESGNLKSLILLPKYSPKDTEQPIDRQVGALDWLVAQIARVEPSAQIDLVGFSLGGVIATRWGALNGPTSPNAKYVRSIITIDSPLGGIPVAGPLDISALSPIGHLMFGDAIAQELALDGQHSLVASLEMAADHYPMTIIENSLSLVTNGDSIMAETGPPWAQCEPSIVGSGARWLGTLAHPSLEFHQASLGGQSYKLPEGACFGIPEALSIVFGNHGVTMDNAQTADWVLAAASRSIAVQPPQSVVAWGCQGRSVDAGQCRVPRDLGDVRDVAAGPSYSLALRRDGTVVAWGCAGGLPNKQCDLPGDLGQVVAIAAGNGHGLALKADGTVLAWGCEKTYPNGKPLPTYAGECDMPDLTGVSAISAGTSHNLALLSDGVVVAWGCNYADPDLHGSGECDVPTDLNGVVAISAGLFHSLALKSDGTVVAWGCEGQYANSGQCAVPNGLTGVTAISAGGTHSLALKSDGTVVVWGCHSPDQYAQSDSGQCNVPSGLTGVKAIAAGHTHSLALKSDGTVVAWGCQSSSGLPVGVDAGECSPPIGLTGVKAISASVAHSLAIRMDSVRS